MIAVSSTPWWFAPWSANKKPCREGPHGIVGFLDACQGSRPRRLPAILAPVDFGESCQTSVDYAARMAAQSNASVVLLHVIERINPLGLLNVKSRRKIKSAAHDRACGHLAAIAARYDASRVPIQCLVRDGLIEYEILRLAESGDISLIVLGRSRRVILQRLLFGDVVDDVVACARCPVLVVPA